MNRFGFWWRCSSTVAGLGLVGFTAGQAQESASKAPPVVSPAPAESLSRTQQDFATIKAARDGTLILPRAEMPRLTMPEWQGTAAPQTTVTLKKPAPDAKSANWLVDAMKKETSTRDARKTTADERGRDLNKSALDDIDEKELSRAERSDSQAHDRDKKDRANSTPAANPLARYLGDWMTPQDYALLKPGLAESLGNRSDVKFDPTTLGPPAAGGGILSAQNDISLGALGSTPPPNIPAVRPENPYLQALSPQTASALASAAQTKAITTNAPPSVLTPSALAPIPPIPSAPSRIPDLARPASDEKYFKQLKRF